MIIANIDFTECPFPLPDFDSSDDDVMPYPVPTRPKIMRPEKTRVKRAKRSDVPSEGMVRTNSKVSTKATEVSADLRLNQEGRTDLVVFSSELHRSFLDFKHTHRKCKLCAHIYQHLYLHHLLIYKSSIRIVL